MGEPIHIRSPVSFAAMKIQAPIIGHDFPFKKIPNAASNTFRQILFIETSSLLQCTSRIIKSESPLSRKCVAPFFSNLRFKYFTDRSKAVLCSVLCLLCLCARLFICALWSPAGKGLTSWFSFVASTVSLSLSHWYPGSGVVLDCIDS